MSKDRHEWLCWQLAVCLSFPWKWDSRSSRSYKAWKLTVQKWPRMNTKPTIKRLHQSRVSKINIMDNTMEFIQRWSSRNIYKYVGKKKIWPIEEGVGVRYLFEATWMRTLNELSMFNSMTTISRLQLRLGTSIDHLLWRELASLFDEMDNWPTPTIREFIWSEIAQGMLAH